MYRFIIKKPAKKFIDGLPINERRRIVDAIEKLSDSGDIKGHSDLFRLRVGAYRIPYTVDNGEFVIYGLMPEKPGARFTTDIKAKGRGRISPGPLPCNSHSPPPPGRERYPHPGKSRGEATGGK